MAKQAFEGIKILDLTWMGVGPVSIKYLADHGATVVHLQSHTRPCPLSGGTPFKGPSPHPDRGWWGVIYNTSKYSLAVDLAKPKAREICRRLISEWKPDIMAESFGRDVMSEWGLDYESVTKLKPDIIYYSTSQMGREGPMAGWAGHGGNASALTGWFHLTGWPDRPPSYVYGAYTDFICPRYGSMTIIAALAYRLRTGKGVYLDQCQLENSLHIMAPLLMDYTITGRIAGRDGNRLPYAAPHGVYPCKGEDRWVAIAVFSDDEWQAFCRVIGNPEWTKGPKFSTLSARKENEDELDRLVGEWTKDFIAEQVEAMMQAGGVAASVVESITDMLEDPQLKHRGHYRWLDWQWPGRGEGELTAFDGPNFRLSKTPDSQWAPDTYGQHDHYILKEFLGMSDDEIADLFAEKVLTTEDDIVSLR